MKSEELAFAKSIQKQLRYYSTRTPIQVYQEKTFLVVFFFVIWTN